MLAWGANMSAHRDWLNDVHNHGNIFVNLAVISAVYLVYRHREKRACEHMAAKTAAEEREKQTASEIDTGYERQQQEIDVYWWESVEQVRKSRLADQLTPTEIEKYEFARNEALRWGEAGYPSHITEAELHKHGWTDALIASALDPAEVSVTFAAPGVSLGGSISLYDDDRVSHAEETHQGFKDRVNFLAREKYELWQAKQKLDEFEESQEERKREYELERRDHDERSKNQVTVKVDEITE
jgi:hypothetical protein